MYGCINSTFLFFYGLGYYALIAIAIYFKGNILYIVAVMVYCFSRDFVGSWASKKHKEMFADSLIDPKDYGINVKNNKPPIEEVTGFLENIFRKLIVLFALISLHTGGNIWLTMAVLLLERVMGSQNDKLLLARTIDEADDYHAEGLEKKFKTHIKDLEDRIKTLTGLIKGDWD